VLSVYVVIALGVGSGVGAKHGKIKKLKAGDIRRLKEKLIENEKLTDKDETSSTTTETSSIEADDKVKWLLDSESREDACL